MVITREFMRFEAEVEFQIRQFFQLLGQRPLWLIKS